MRRRAECPSWRCRAYDDNPGARSMIFFTVCSRNFLAYSHTLWTSLKKFHPDAQFYAVLCDERGGFDEQALPYPTIGLAELGIARLEEMKARYNITEMNTAVKPFAFHYL